MTEKFYLFAKRVFDLILASVVLFISFPFFVFFSIAIKLDSKGGVFYRAKRTGKNSRVFKMYKFRSMFENADKIKIFSTSEDDSRITKIGKLMRKYKIDEIPQLMNILKGEMSFVGPRPEVPYYTSMFKGEEKDILSIKPGFTDFASVKFRNEAELLKGSDNPDKAYEELIRPEKIRLQLKYMQKRNFWLDIKIVLKTISKVL